MMYARYPLSLRNVEDLLFERGIDICHETVGLLVEPFGQQCQAKRAAARVHDFFLGRDHLMDEAGYGVFTGVCLRNRWLLPETGDAAGASEA